MDAMDLVSFNLRKDRWDYVMHVAMRLLAGAVMTDARESRTIKPLRDARGHVRYAMCDADGRVVVQGDAFDIALAFVDPQAYSEMLKRRSQGDVTRENIRDRDTLSTSLG